MINRLCFLIAFFAVVVSAEAKNYYVSPAGDDGAGGLSIETAWASIDNGEQLGMIDPGDTVFILPGQYSPTSSIVLTTSGQQDSSIVYQGIGQERTYIYGGFQPSSIFDVRGDYIELRGLEISNSPQQAIDLNGDNCTIANCYIRNIGKHGILITGSDNLLVRNIVSSTMETGIRNEGFGHRTHIYGNTVYSAGKYGIEITSTVNLVRIFNNIVAYSGADGITAPDGNVCGFNNVWGSAEDNYGSSAYDSAGGMIALPGMIDPLYGRFDLELECLEIDAGLDLGLSLYRFNPRHWCHREIPEVLRQSRRRRLQ